MSALWFLVPNSLFHVIMTCSRSLKAMMPNAKAASQRTDAITRDAAKCACLADFLCRRVSEEERNERQWFPPRLCSGDPTESTLQNQWTHHFPDRGGPF